MSIRSVISCDVCKRDQGAVNHWFVAWVEKGEYHACSIKKKRESTKNDKHACGTDCEVVLHNRWLTTGNLTIEMHERKVDKPVGLTEESILKPEQFANVEPLQ